MTKAEQKAINARCTAELEYALTGLTMFTPSERLRKCSAEVYETAGYYILKSYSTFIACIDKHTGELFDALRVVYGYTNSSARQVSKFAEDYSAGRIYTAR